jgi:uncharacterized protein (UPF0218 family)
MKILVSSKHLAAKLNEIDFNNDKVMSIGDNVTEVIIKTINRDIELYAEILIFSANPIDQQERRWDWIKELVNKVDEQPICLDIKEKFVNVIFQY